MSYKLSNFMFLINRAFRISSDINLGDELGKIKRIAIDNGYQVKLIIKLIQSSFDTSKSKNKTINEVNMKSVVASYFPGFFEHIKNHLRNFGLCLIAKPPPKLKMLLNTKIDPINRDDLSEAYMIPFIREGGIKNHYIGITQRNFNIRCKEHIANIKYNKGNNPFSRLNQI